ncbi:MAG: MATE family efflux transporter [Bacteroidia bacterium]
MNSIPNNNHFKQLWLLAWPLILTQIGHIITGMVDTYFLGKVGVTEQASGILANNLFMLVLVFGIGMSYATTPLVANAHEMNNIEEKASYFKNSVLLNIICSIFLFAILFFLSPLLNHMNQPEDVVTLATPYYHVINFSLIPVSIFFVCKQYCEGVSNTKAALIISIIGNLINIPLNYALIYGKFGLPELGYMGTAWATLISRIIMAIGFLLLMYKMAPINEIFSETIMAKINFPHFKRLLKIGLSSAMQFSFEVAAFVIAGLMSGSFGKEQLDAHGIALHLAAFTYMFASGISGAATIRTGMFKAKNNWHEINQTVIASIKMIFLFMGIAAIGFLLTKSYLPTIFSDDESIIELTSRLLIIAALFQLFDGLQVTIIGVLRGLEDIKIPTAVTLIGYWIVALGMCYFLAFHLQIGVIGVWIGLLIGLVFVAVSLLWRYVILYRDNRPDEA